MNTSPILVLYHAECLDGYAAAWSAWKHLGHHAQYKPVRHYQPIPNFAEHSTLYIVDFCYPLAKLCQAAKKAKQIIVLDHHISAENDYKNARATLDLPNNLSLQFNQQQSGCLLSWHYFHPDQPVPKLLTHIQDHDLWQHQLKHTEEICKALYLKMPLPFHQFETLNVNRLIQEGKILLKQQQATVKRLLTARHPILINGIKGLAVNASAGFSSDLGHELAKLSQTFGMTYFYNGKRQQYECGLRSIGDFDTSILAQSFGGGGHKNASGFSIPQDTFLKLLNEK